MSRRSWQFVFFVCVLATLTLLAYRVFVPAPPTKTLNVAGFAQLRVGMTLAEVEDLLGGPPGNYGRHAGGWAEMTLEGFMSLPGAVEKVWNDDRNRFEIYFDAANRVVGIHRRAGFQQMPPQTWWTKVRSWFVKE